MNDAATPDPQILRYQSGRGLDAVPGYRAGLQLRLSNGRRVYVALSPTELALYFDSDIALHYDLEGRLLKTSERDRYRRRSLSHRVLVVHKRAPERSGSVTRELVAEPACDATVAEAHELTAAVERGLRDGSAITEFEKPTEEPALAEIRAALAKAARFDVRAAHESAARFHSVYGRVGVLPPDQYNALLLQATEGCAYSGCLFCELYRDALYGCKTPAQFREHVKAVAAFHGEGLRARRSIFLGEANALALPQKTLLGFLRILNEHFELPLTERDHVPASWWLGSKTRFDGVSSFLDAFSGRPHTAAEFSAMRALGLRRVYIGMETGSDVLLRWLRKPASAEKIRRTVRALKEARLAVGAIVLLGAGGRQFDLVHAKATTELLNELALGAGDYVYFSPLVIYSGSRYEERTKTLNVEPLTPQEIDEQERRVRDGLRRDARRGRPYIARYPLEVFSY